MTAASPRVTVLMPVYNGASFLPAAVSSILQQTFADFEFLVIDDGSTDESAAVIESFRDARIRLVRNGANLGLVASLNRGLELARGAYIARMDADDISLPERLQLQVSFMEANPEVGICGSWLEGFDGRVRTLWSPPLADQEIKASLIFESVLYHPTVMMRQTVLSAAKSRYVADYPHAEDYALWCSLSRYCRFANIGEVLLKYRLHDESIGSRHSALQAVSARRIRQGVLAELGLVPTEAELELHQAISAWRIEPDRRFLERAQNWLLNLLRANEKSDMVAQQVLEKELAKRWHQICFLAAPMGIDACRYFHQSPLSRFLPLSLRHRVVFLMRALLGRGKDLR